MNQYVKVDFLQGVAFQEPTVYVKFSNIYELSLLQTTCRNLNPNPDGWGVYDSRNLKQTHLKMGRSKNVFYPSYIPHKMYYNYILLKVFI